MVGRQSILCLANIHRCPPLSLFGRKKRKKHPLLFSCPPPLKSHNTPFLHVHPSQTTTNKKKTTTTKTQQTNRHHPFKADLPALNILFFPASRGYGTPGLYGPPGEARGLSARWIWATRLAGFGIFFWGAPPLWPNPPQTPQVPPQGKGRWVFGVFHQGSTPPTGMEVQARLFQEEGRLSARGLCTSMLAGGRVPRKEKEKRHRNVSNVTCDPDHFCGSCLPPPPRFERANFDSGGRRPWICGL